MNRIAIIGNGGGGKTTLARSLAEKLHLPLVHVDSIQFLAGMNVRDSAETSRILNDLADKDQWIIDGFGTMEVMEKRFRRADKIIFVDFPLWRHYWWCAKRQLRSIFSPRSELPAGCNEATLAHTIDLCKILWRVHTQIRPKLIALFQTKEMESKVVRVSNLQEWKRIFRNEF